MVMSQASKKNRINVIFRINYHSFLQALRDFFGIDKHRKAEHHFINFHSDVYLQQK